MTINMEYQLWKNLAWVANFERPRMFPTALNSSSTGLSPYLRFGCLSARLFYWELTDLYKKVKRSERIPLSLHGQLLWREFFFAAGCKNPNFDQMRNNPICVQIPWNKNSEFLRRWTNGETGFPWIDAIMIQLNQEGWIHPLARHAVSCFLTRGDLWICWEEGVKVFEELMLDADWSVNAGNWIWLSCSSFYQQFFHCYCPVKFGRRTDPEGEFVRKYLPILKNYPAKYIFEPWTAPLAVQKQAKCVIGEDYPLPIVNHAEASHANIEKLKKVFKDISKHGGPGLLGAVPSSKAASNKPENLLTISGKGEANQNPTRSWLPSTKMRDVGYSQPSKAPVTYEQRDEPQAKHIAPATYFQQSMSAVNLVNNVQIMEKHTAPAAYFQQSMSAMNLVNNVQVMDKTAMRGFLPQEVKQSGVVNAMQEPDKHGLLAFLQQNMPTTSVLQYNQEAGPSASGGFDSSLLFTYGKT